MNIAIGKISKSVRFDKEYRKAGKGDLAPMASFITLAKNHPEDKFYIIGASDMRKSAATKEDRERNEIPENIIDLGSIAKARHTCAKKGFSKLPMGEEFTVRENLCEYIIDVINERDIKFDYGIFFLGPDCSVSTPYCYSPDAFKKTGEKKFMKPLVMSENYAATIIHAINTLKFPYIFVNEDPRYVPMIIRDIISDETCFLSHLNKKHNVRRIHGYFDDSLKEKRVHEEDFIYAGIERTSLLFLKKYDFRNKDDFIIDGKHYSKDGFFFVACNESPSRFTNIKNWVLDQFPDVNIYGRWSDETIKGYESRFINKPMAYLQDELWRSKYTFIPGFFDRMTNFVTIKVWEMCIYGILPFFDNKKYDTDHLAPVPDFLRCSSPAEMKEKIERLEADPALYQKRLNEIYDIVSDDYFNGKFINKIFDPIFRKNGKDITVEDWRENSQKLIEEYKNISNKV